MKIIHRISLSISSEQQKEFSNLGIQLSTGFTSFEIAEEDRLWQKTYQLVKKYKAVDVPYTKFSKNDLSKSKYLGVTPAWHNGYPEPSDDMAYLTETYDLSNYCQVCGLGKIQKSPFKIKSKVAWGNKSIFQLHWIYDEYFVKKDVWLSLFKKYKIDSLPVQDINGNVIDEIVQLKLTEHLNLNAENLKCDVCDHCNRSKFQPVARGYYPMPPATMTHAFKSQQYFGSGASAHQMIFFSNELYNEIFTNKIKGIDFAACNKTNEEIIH